MIGDGGTAGRGIWRQLRLVQLNEVLGLSARAIQGVETHSGAPCSRLVTNNAPSRRFGQVWSLTPLPRPPYAVITHFPAQLGERDQIPVAAFPLAKGQKPAQLCHRQRRAFSRRVAISLPEVKPSECIVKE